MAEWSSKQRPAPAAPVRRRRAAELADRRASGPATVQLQDNRGAVVQAKSYVKNTGQTFTWGKHKTIVGKKMEAWLDPNDPVQGESANINADQTPMMDALRAHYVINGGDLVKGHLLNDNLGGKALNNNLFPITRAANKLHLQTTENYAKSALWTHKTPIWYTVEVGGAADANQTSHTFDVKLGKWDMKNNKLDGAAVQGAITSNMGDPRDYEGANSDDMDTYSAGTLKAAVAKKLALHPHNKVSGMSKHETDFRDSAGAVTNTEHGSGGYTSYS